MANGQSPRAIVPALLSDDDIERRKRLAGLQDADLARIAAVRDLVVRSVDQFCAIFFDYLAGSREAGGLFNTPSVLREAKRLEREHVIAMVGGDYGQSYVEQRLGLGVLYGKAGINVPVLLGAYERLMQSIGVGIANRLAGDPHEAFQRFMSLNKICVFDTGIIADVLIDACLRTIARQEDTIRELKGSASKRPTDLLVEYLSPLEMSLQDYRESNARLMVLNETLRHAKAAADAANSELEAFSYSVAHDLRAPLRAIDGFSQALLEDYNDRLNDEGRTYLRFVRESAQHMAELIDGLLNLSRVARSELRQESSDLSSLARGVLAQLQRAEPDRKVETIIADEIVVQSDSRLLKIALENLLGNAWKFTSKRPDARIELGSTVSEGQPTIFVRDNGAGFDQAYAGKLFGVFQRLHGASEFEGTGIGLATVQRIVSRHGGRIWAEGAIDKGATFYFTLGGGETLVRREVAPEAAS
jgi:signal transduction histidine kinase